MQTWPFGHMGRLKLVPFLKHFDLPATAVSQMKRGFGTAETKAYQGSGLDNLGLGRLACPPTVRCDS